MVQNIMLNVQCFSRFNHFSQMSEMFLVIITVSVLFFLSFDVSSSVLKVFTVCCRTSTCVCAREAFILAGAASCVTLLAGFAAYYLQQGFWCQIHGYAQDPYCVSFYYPAMSIGARSLKFAIHSILS